MARLTNAESLIRKGRETSPITVAKDGNKRDPEAQETATTGRKKAVGRKR
jgi:hypothetical protein